MAYFINNRNPEYCRGDIFYINQSDNVGSDPKPGRPGIIVSNDSSNAFSPYVSVVLLTTQEKKPLPTHVEVFCKTRSTAMCETIQTVPKERLGDFVKSCTFSEMANIDKALYAALGLPDPVLDTSEKRYDPTPSGPSVVLETEIERDLYKRLYEQLLDRVTGRDNT